MSVDTNTKNKNLQGYRTIRRDDDLRILVSPKLMGFSGISIDTRGFPFKKVKAVIERDDDACTI